MHTLSPRIIRYKFAKLMDGRLARFELADAEHAVQRTHETIAKYTDRSSEFYSGMEGPAVAEGFEQILAILAKSGTDLRFLEIGSCQGFSMSVIGLLAKKLWPDSDVLLHSVDPYLDDGYVEGQGAPMGLSDLKILIGEGEYETARRTYADLGLVVEIHRQKSIDWFRSRGRNLKYTLIYIDGRHAGVDPLLDLGHALQCVESGGIVVLDDWNWMDVYPCKKIMDRTYERIYQNYKIAAYRIDRAVVDST